MKVAISCRIRYLSSGQHSSSPCASVEQNNWKGEDRNARPLAQRDRGQYQSGKTNGLRATTIRLRLTRGEDWTTITKERGRRFEVGVHTSSMGEEHKRNKKSERKIRRIRAFKQPSGNFRLYRYERSPETSWLYGVAVKVRVARLPDPAR